MNRLKNKKLRKKCENIKRLASLNELHDLKHQHTVNRVTTTLMRNSDLVKPRRLNKTGSLINTLKYVQGDVRIIEK